MLTPLGEINCAAARNRTSVPSVRRQVSHSIAPPYLEYIPKLVIYVRVFHHLVGALPVRAPSLLQTSTSVATSPVATGTRLQPPPLCCKSFTSGIAFHTAHTLASTQPLVPLPELRSGQYASRLSLRTATPASRSRLARDLEIGSAHVPVMFRVALRSGVSIPPSVEFEPKLTGKLRGLGCPLLDRL